MHLRLSAIMYPFPFDARAAPALGRAGAQPQPIDLGGAFRRPGAAKAPDDRNWMTQEDGKGWGRDGLEGCSSCGPAKSTRGCHRPEHTADRLTCVGARTALPHYTTDWYLTNLI